MRIEEICQCESLDKYLEFFISHTPIYLGSHGTTFGLLYKDGQKYFLKPYPPRRESKIEDQFKLMQDAYKAGMPIAQPITLVKFAKGGGILSSWIEGISLESKEAKKLLFVSPSYQYRLGYDCAAAIKKLHLMPVNCDIAASNKVSDSIYYRLDKYKKHTSCKQFHHCIDKFQRYIERNNEAFFNRQISYVHRDYRYQNLMLCNGEIMCVDTDIIEPGDPWADLVFLFVSVTSTKLSYLYNGLVHHYFGEDPPKTFWQVMTLYHVLWDMHLYYASAKADNLKDSKKILAKLMVSVDKLQTDTPPPWYISYNKAFDTVVQTSNQSFGFIFDMASCKLLWVLTLLKHFFRITKKIASPLLAIRRLLK